MRTLTALLLAAAFLLGGLPRSIGFAPARDCCCEAGSSCMPEPASCCAADEGAVLVAGCPCGDHGPEASLIHSELHYAPLATARKAPPRTARLLASLGTTDLQGRAPAPEPPPPRPSAAG